MGNNEAKQKAKELIEYFDELLTYRESKQKVKQCAIKVCDEIIKALTYPPNPTKHRQVVHIETLKYWKRVKKEIENYEQ